VTTASDSPLRVVTSDSLTPNAFTLIRTQPGLRAGTGTSWISSASRPPGRVTATPRLLAGAVSPAAVGWLMPSSSRCSPAGALFRIAR
jgi:hypothetical protein